MAGSTNLMTLRYPGVCVTCGAAVPAKSSAYFDRTTKTVTCRPCAEPAASDPVADIPRQRIAAGTAGGSAQREYDRRSAKRKARIRAEHPIMGRLILALSDEPQSTKAWAAGARGEQVVAQWLDQLTSHGVRVLHDRRIPRTRANIDHLVIGPAGVFVIDSKYYRGRRIELRTQGGWGRPRLQKLVVGGRDQTKLVEGIHWQVQLVREFLAAHGGNAVPVVGMLCFVDAEWPPGSSPLVIDDIHILWPKKIRDQVRRAGVLDETAIGDWHRLLAGAFRPA